MSNSIFHVRPLDSGKGCRCAGPEFHPIDPGCVIMGAPSAPLDWEVRHHAE